MSGFVGSLPRLCGMPGSCTRSKAPPSSSEGRYRAACWQASCVRISMWWLRVMTLSCGLGAGRGVPLHRSAEETWHLMAAAAALCWSGGWGICRTGTRSTDGQPCIASRTCNSAKRSIIMAWPCLVLGMPDIADAELVSVDLFLDAVYNARTVETVHQHVVHNSVFRHVTV
jgi:hypothetical protein